MFGSAKRGDRKRDIGITFSEFSKSLTLIADLEQLKDNVIAKIRDAVTVEDIFLFLKNPDLNVIELTEARTSDSAHPADHSLAPDSSMIQWFAVNETHLVVSQNPAVLSYFSERERAMIRDMGITIIMPLFVMNRITGLVCFGNKAGGGSFTGDEIDVLNTFLGQAAFAFENAYLYKQQKSRLKKMYRADRLATLGQLAAGAAHEIRNPLTSIRSTIQYLQKDLRDTPKANLVTGVLEEVDRINGIIEGLLSFAKPSTPQTERFDLKCC
jgi:two-component system, NtrC family, sensor kinase